MPMTMSRLIRILTLRIPLMELRIHPYSNHRFTRIPETRRIYATSWCRFSTTTQHLEVNSSTRKYTNEQTEYISQVVCSKQEYSSQEWEKIFQETYPKGKYITPGNISAVILKICIAHKIFSVAESLIRHLTRSQTEINIATLSKYLRLCYETWPSCSETTIIHYSEQLCSRVPIMDANTSESVILALSRTSQWRKSLEHLETMKLTCSPGPFVYSSVIEAIFNNGDSNTGWNLIRKATKEGKKLKSEVYLAWISFCKHHGHSLNDIEVLLNYLSEYDIAVSKSVAEEVKKYMEEIPSLPWNGKFSVIADSGICRACDNHLQSIHFSKEQFEKLRSTFLKNVLLGKDIFTKSTPAEIQAFQKFLETSYPFDVVIDGLNVAFSTGAVGKSAIQSRTLRKVLEQFISRDHDVVVLGRKHMLAWPKDDVNYMKRNAKLFLANDLSQDDPLLLYATLYGGPHTYFVSRDLMRGHAFRLGDTEMAQLFRRWQQWRQYQVITHKSSNRITVIPPMKYLPVAQKSTTNISNDSLWHIPYQDDVNESTVILDLPYKWLCLKQAK